MVAMRIALLVVLGACSYAPSPTGGGDDVTSGPDSTLPGDDARPAAKPQIYVGSETQFGIFDVETKTVSMVGPWIVEGTNVGVTMYELTMGNDGDLLGISAPPSTLYRVNTATGRLTKIALLDQPNEQFWGASTAPASSLAPVAEVFGGTPNGTLFRIDPESGHVSSVGAFGGGLSVSGDLVWVDGVGLMGTMNGGSCDDCLAKISTTTGQATVVKPLAMGDCYATGSVNGRLFVFRGAGHGYEIDPQTGNAIDDWDMPGQTWSVAAP